MYTPCNGYFGVYCSRSVCLNSLGTWLHTRKLRLQINDYHRGMGEVWLYKCHWKRHLVCWGFIDAFLLYAVDAVKIVWPSFIFFGIQNNLLQKTWPGIIACSGVRIAEYLTKKDFDIESSLLCARCDHYVPPRRNRQDWNVVKGVLVELPISVSWDKAYLGCFMALYAWCLCFDVRSWVKLAGEVKLSLAMDCLCKGSML